MYRNVICIEALKLFLIPSVPFNRYANFMKDHIQEFTLMESAERLEYS